MFDRVGALLCFVVVAWVLFAARGAGAAPPPDGFPLPFPTVPAPPPPPDSPTTGPAMPLDPRSVSAATAAVEAFAKQAAPGMAPDGPMVAGQFKLGEVLAQPIQLLAGKCYTVIAVGTGITEVGITLEALTPLPGSASTFLAEDRETGPRAALGGRGNCFKITSLGMNARFVIKAGLGSGVAAGQVYVK